MPPLGGLGLNFDCPKICVDGYIIPWTNTCILSGREEFLGGTFNFSCIDGEASGTYEVKQDDFRTSIRVSDDVVTISASCKQGGPCLGDVTASLDAVLNDNGAQAISGVLDWKAPDDAQNISFRGSFGQEGPDGKRSYYFQLYWTICQ